MQQVKGGGILLVDKLLFALSHDYESIIDIVMLLSIQQASNDDWPDFFEFAFFPPLARFFEWLSMMARARDKIIRRKCPDFLHVSGTEFTWKVSGFFYAFLVLKLRRICGRLLRVSGTEIT